MRGVSRRSYLNQRVALPVLTQMDIRYTSLSIKELDGGDMPPIPSLDDLFWEYMHTQKRYVLSPDE
ncbi:hypothetical protein CPB86DRAFT_809930 [Serendipita vermifera]|nr:hypothetical protein CPB86DRAFT_809930 [Serendipita vermifera]